MSISSFGKKLALTAQSLVMALGFSVFAVAAIPAVASAATAAPCDSTLTIQNGANCANPNTSSKGLFEPGGIFQIVANTLIFLVGAIAVLFLIIGGLRYVVSNGDSKQVEGAKNTILYAIIGIVVAIVSYAAVSFVIQQLTAS